MRTWQSDRGKSGATRRAPARKSAPSKKSIASGGSLKEYPFLRRFYQHQATIGVGLQKFLFLLAVATLLYAFVFGDAGAIKVLSLKKQHNELASQLATLELNTLALTDEIDGLKTDPFKMEKLGREMYGYAYPGDRVYKLIRRHRP